VVSKRSRYAVQREKKKQECDDVEKGQENDKEKSMIHGGVQVGQHIQEREKMQGGGLASRGDA
jgi:hypothetical protein